MISLGYKQSQGDYTLFIKHSLYSKFTLLLLYVDNMIIASDDEIELAKHFEMELGKLKYFLGIEIAYYRKGIFISQRKFVLDQLKETGKLGCKTTRPDVAYVVSVVNQFMHHPRERHLQAVKRIFHYLKASPGTELKKQNVVARSNVVAEFRAMAHGIYKELWMKIILDIFKVKYEGLIKLFCHNNSTISIAHPVQHNKTKHIEIDRHFIK
ncbi:Copia protein, partial [Mucuna pruriens]